MECKFLWFVENYSYIGIKNGNSLGSPKFTPRDLDSTTWELRLFPNGVKQEDSGKIFLFLRRDGENDTGPEAYRIHFQLSILTADGSALYSEDFKGTFSRYSTLGPVRFIATNELLLQRRAEYLPKDTLSVCCKIWKEGSIQNVQQISSRTLIKFERISILHVVESFSKLQRNVNQTIEIPCYSKKRGVVSSSLYITDCLYEDIMIEIESSNAKQFLLKCNLSLLDTSGNMVDCGGIDYRYGPDKINTRKLPLSLKREVILKRKSKYLPNDKLSVLCESIFSTPFVNETIEEILYGLPLTVIKKKNDHTHCKDFSTSSNTLTDYPTALEDMKTMYMNQRFADVELRTKTKSFKAHKNVLCARSPVFEAMLTSDMKEKNSSCIQVDDLENDTVQQLLLFFYSDSLENLQWQNATQLYYAADKYQVGRLKAKCSTFLTENLSTANASELLLLADTHNDSHLKKVVEDFILKHEEQVFGSKGWEKLIETNPTLVIKTMHLKYKRKNEDN